MPDVPILSTNQCGEQKIVAWMSVGGDYKPGDQPPSGYCDWHEWAEVQFNSGLRQKRCSQCGLFQFPQEIAIARQESQTTYKTKKDENAKMNPITSVVSVVVCKKCQSSS